jgi:hypothetical protein
MQQFAGLDLDAAVAQAFGQDAVVAAPGQMQGEDLAQALGEPRLARQDERRRVVRGAAGAVVLD